MRKALLSSRGTNRYARLLLIAVLVATGLILLPPLLIFLFFLIVIRPIRNAEPEPVVKPYRGGDVSVSPPSVVAGGKPVHVEISYRVGPEGIQNGGGVKLCRGKILRFGRESWRLSLQWANGWGNPQRRKPDKPNYLDVRSSREDVELKVSMMEHAVDRTQLRWLKRKFLQKIGIDLPPMDPRDAFIKNQKVTMTVVGGRLEEGDTITFDIGTGSGMQVPYDEMETDFAIQIDPTGNGDYILESAVPVLKATGGKPDNLEVIAPSRALPGQRIKVLVRCLDSRGVLTPEFSGRLRISSSGRIQVPDSVIVRGEGDGVAWFQAAVAGPGEAHIRVTGQNGSLEGESNPVLCAPSDHLLLWGDLHTHSTVSDGTREPWYYYYRARELMGWDFTAVTDHDIWSLAEEHPRTDDEFALMVSAADDNNQDGRFVTFPAYEWTDHHLGHRNVLFGPGEEPVFFTKVDPRYATPDKLMEALSGKKVLVIPHHPAWKTHRGEMHYDYGTAGDPHQRLIEVYSTHGSSEYFGCPRPITHAELIEGMTGKMIRVLLGKEFAGPESGSYARDALAAGHRLGLVAGSDGHLVGIDPRKGVGLKYRGGLTCALSDAITRDALWDALWNRRVFATTGARMIIEFLVNGSPQGSELSSDTAPVIKGFVIGTSNIELVELVKFDGEGYSVPWHWEGHGTRVHIDFTDRAFKDSSFYYLRVVQEDGHLGWAGPTWVDKALA